MYHVLHPRKHIFRDKVCISKVIGSWGMKYLIFSFLLFFFFFFFFCLFCLFVFFSFFGGGHFESAPGEEVHPQIFLFTLQILILLAADLQKNISLKIYGKGAWWDCLVPILTKRFNDFFSLLAIQIGYLCSNLPLGHGELITCLHVYICVCV